MVGYEQLKNFLFCYWIYPACDSSKENLYLTFSKVGKGEEGGKEDMTTLNSYDRNTSSFHYMFPKQLFTIKTKRFKISLYRTSVRWFLFVDYANVKSEDGPNTLLFRIFPVVVPTRSQLFWKSVTESKEQTKGDFHLCYRRFVSESQGENKRMESSNSNIRRINSSTGGSFELFNTV